jgi:hypothetical protein
MPPLPIILDEQAQRLIFSAQRLRDDLVEVKIPGLRGCTGPKALQQRLAEELREDVNRLARELEVCFAFDSVKIIPPSPTLFRLCNFRSGINAGSAINES